MKESELIKGCNAFGLLAVKASISFLLGCIIEIEPACRN